MNERRKNASKKRKHKKRDLKKVPFFCGVVYDYRVVILRAILRFQRYRGGVFRFQYQDTPIWRLAPGGAAIWRLRPATLKFVELFVRCPSGHFWLAAPMVWQTEGCAQRGLIILRLHLASPGPKTSQKQKAANSHWLLFKLTNSKHIKTDCLRSFRHYLLRHFPPSLFFSCPAPSSAD